MRNPLTTLYGDADMARVMFGDNARHVPGWMYVQDQGDGTVSFVGSSRVKDAPHPLRYGSDRTHQFFVGELIVRPHLVIATDALRGTGLAGLATGKHDIPAMLRAGEPVIDLGRVATRPNPRPTGGNERWRVDHPGIGVLAYDTERKARAAAGTAGTLIPPGGGDR